MAEKKKIPNLQKKMNKTLEEFFAAKKGGQQPVGTSVNPLGAFAIKPMVQDFMRPVSFPTPLPQKPFDFKPIFSTDKTKDGERGDDHPGRDKKSKLIGQAHEGGDRAYGIEGEGHLGKMPRPKIDGEMAEGKDKAFGLKAPEKPAKTKAFQIPGDEHKPRDKASSLEGQAHTPKDRAFGLKGGSHKGAVINSPFGETPNKSTHELNPIEQGAEHSTVEPISMAETPEKSTAEIPPMPETPTKDGFSPNEAFLQPIEFTYADRGTNGHDPSGVLKIHQDQSPKDKKPWEGVAGDGTNWQHLNNNETRFTKVDENVFQFDNKMPAGGTSTAIWTRAFYNKGLKLVENDGSNYSAGAGRGSKVPENTLTLKKGDVGDGTEGGLFNKSGKVASRNLEKMYKKVGKNKFISLRDEAKRNNPRASLWLPSPQVQRGLSKGADNPSNFMEKIHDLTAPIIDLVRVGKYLASPDGLLFMAKQVGLQLSNPKGQFTKDLHANRIFNPLAFALQVPANVLGIHIDRHNMGPLNEESGLMGITYEGMLRHSEPDIDKVYQNNRLVGLLDDFGLGHSGDYNPKIVPGGVIDSLSGKMGPNSLYGIIGRTDIRSSKAGVGGAAIETSNYTPDTPYAKTYAGSTSEVKQGESAPDFQITVGSDGRDDYDSYWTKKVEKLGTGDAADLPSRAAHGFPSSTGPIDPLETIIGQYGTHDYETLKKFRGQPKSSIIDFRDPENIEYKNNILQRLRLTDYGKARGASEAQDMYGDDPDNDNDFVKIKIVSVDPELTVMVRAYNLEVEDKLTPSYSEIKYSGNPAASHVFDTIGRSFSIKFAVPSFSSQELKRNYLRLNDLMRLASPKIVSKYASGNILEITVGHLWQDVPCVVDSFDYKFMDDQWDIAFGKGHETSGFELPMHFECTVGGKFVLNADGGVWNNNGEFFNSEIWADITGPGGSGE